MKIILPGYNGSKCIIGPSSYLMKKYIPKMFDIYWLNYGEFKGNVHVGTYVQLDVFQFGGSMAWAQYLLDFINTLDDEFVILGLDDYFILELMNMDRYKKVLSLLKGPDVCGRLHMDKEYKYEDEKNPERATDGYLVTAQFNIWRRSALAEILAKVNSPWQFEIDGSGYMRDETKYSVIGYDNKPALTYINHSVLSTKWDGINYEGLSSEDFREMRNYGYL